MIIVTNVASNVDVDIVRRYGVCLTTQDIVADGKRYDTRNIARLATVDQLVRHSVEHPFVLSISASEYAMLLRDLASRDRQLVVLTSPRKIINAHQAVESGLEALKARPGYGDLDVEIVDTGATDVGAALVAIFCILSAEAGRPFHEVVANTRMLARDIVFTSRPDSLEFLVKAGHVSGGRALMAKVLRRAPVLRIANGELAAIGTVSAGKAPHQLIDTLVPESMYGRPVWVAVSHADEPERIRELVVQLRKRLDVRFMYVRPMSPGVYLDSGPGVFSVAILPVDTVPRVPEVPSDLAERYSGQ